MISSGSIRRSFSHFRTNPLRTFLTLLGVVFGVGSVVAMVSIGEGAQERILAAIDAMGATAVHVRSRPVPDEEIPEIVDDSAGLSRADVDALEQIVGPVRRAAYRSRYALHVTDLPVPPHDVAVLGVSADLFDVHDLKVAEGRPLLRPDHERERRVAVIGAALADRAFPDGEPLGEVFRLGYSYFEVVGVLSGARDLGEDLPVDPHVYDLAIVIPFEAMTSDLRPPPGYGEIDLVTLEVETTEQTLPVKQAVARILGALHGGVEDFDIVAPEEILRQRRAAQSMLNLVLVCIAALSLLVGGIGVMNIMLANIMERIGEIGLRRAIGARRRDIRDQFLLEAVAVCCVGGAIGVALGLGGSWAVSWLADLPVGFAWESMVLSFAIALGVGVIFGIAPAIRAANVDPIEALHGE